MNKLKMLFLILLVLIIIGCTTTQTNVKLPEKPERSYIAPDTTYPEIIAYYEYLVQEWEEYGKSVDKLIDNK